MELYGLVWNGMEWYALLCYGIETLNTILMTIC